MNTFKATLRGVAPMLMHNGRLADPTDPVTREMKRLTSNRKKTDEILLEIKRTEWLGGLYLDEKKRVAVPVDNVLAVAIAGARKSKLGKQAEAGVYPVGGAAWFTLVYDGPTNIEELYADGRFVDYRGVRNQQNRVMRARPIFRDWKLPIELEYEPDIIDERNLMAAFEQAGALVGLGDFRPRYGRFVVEA